MTGLNHLIYGLRMKASRFSRRFGSPLLIAYTIVAGSCGSPEEKNNRSTFAEHAEEADASSDVQKKSDERDEALDARRIEIDTDSVGLELTKDTLHSYPVYLILGDETRQLVKSPVWRSAKPNLIEVQKGGLLFVKNSGKTSLSVHAQNLKSAIQVTTISGRSDIAKEACNHLQERLRKASPAINECVPPSLTAPDCAAAEVNYTNAYDSYADCIAETNDGCLAQMLALDLALFALSDCESSLGTGAECKERVGKIVDVCQALQINACSARNDPACSTEATP